MSTIYEPSRIESKEAGYAQEVLLDLESHFLKLIKDNQIQCASFLLSRNGHVFADGAFGKLRYDDTSELQKHSIRRIASVTKLFTAVAIFQLVEQGKLFLQQNVCDWIEEFNNSMYNGIQIKHLLTHTSGLRADPFYYLEPYPTGWGDILFSFLPEQSDELNELNQLEQEKIHRSAWLKAILAGKPLSQPGEEWVYSSAGYSILGEVIARASKMSYEQYVMEHICKPLGLSRTFFEVPKELRHEVCVINANEQEQLERGLGNSAAPRAGSGLYSSLLDLFRFGQMLLNGGELDGVRILSRKSVEKMTINVLEKGIPAFSWGGKIENKTYGLGPLLISKGEWLQESIYGHEGAGRCILLMDQKKNAVIVFFVPSNVDWCPESMIGTQNLIGAGWL